MMEGVKRQSFDPKTSTSLPAYSGRKQGEGMSEAWEVIKTWPIGTIFAIEAVTKGSIGLRKMHLRSGISSLVRAGCIERLRGGMYKLVGIYEPEIVKWRGICKSLERCHPPLHIAKRLVAEGLGSMKQDYVYRREL